MQEAKDAIIKIKHLIGDCPDLIEKPRDFDVCYSILLYVDNVITKIYKICQEVE